MWIEENKKFQKYYKSVPKPFFHAMKHQLYLGYSGYKINKINLSIQTHVIIFCNLFIQFYKINQPLLKLENSNRNKLNPIRTTNLLTVTIV